MRSFVVKPLFGPARSGPGLPLDIVSHVFFSSIFRGVYVRFLSGGQSGSPASRGLVRFNRSL